MVIGHSSPRILMQITKLVGGRGGPVQPSITVLFTVNKCHAWMKEGRKEEGKLITAEDQYYFRDRDGEEGDSGQKKKQFQLHHFLCFQVSHFKLLTLPVHLSLGKKRIAGFSWRHHGVNKMNTGLGQAINCFSAQMGPGHPWKERKRPCREA